MPNYPEVASEIQPESPPPEEEEQEDENEGLDQEGDDEDEAEEEEKDDDGQMIQMKEVWIQMKEVRKTLGKSCVMKLWKN